jgi:hypothetical protein
MTPRTGGSCEQVPCNEQIQPVFIRWCGNKRTINERAESCSPFEDGGTPSEARQAPTQSSIKGCKKNIDTDCITGDTTAVKGLNRPKRAKLHAKAPPKGVEKHCLPLAPWGHFVGNGLKRKQMALQSLFKQEEWSC